MKKKVVIIGAGASGIMAAISAAKYNKDVILIEKNNQIGKKLGITGGGRCNVTNSCSIDEIIDKTINNGKFLYNCLNIFSNIDLINFLENRGCKLKVEENGKVFPTSDKSEDIITTLLHELKLYKVKVMTNCQANEILKDGDCIIGVRTNNNTVIKCDAVIVTTGGISYPHLGSTGDGYDFARSLGHNITPIKPSLVPMIIKEPWVKDLMGISLKDIQLISKIGKSKKITSIGDLLFTHYGISGPVVLEHSAYLNKHYKNGEHTLFLDFIPNYDIDEINKKFKNEASKNGNKLVKSTLIEILPKNFCNQLFKMLKIEENMRLCEFTKNDKTNLINSLKNLPLTMIGYRPISESIITSGGVSIKEINNKTMESKLVKGLFFAGELLDVDALTGGYNLQIAFSTGFLAGKSV